ncbi:BlaI/MecI/CopY family transcriptional regulator [Amycolatopsis rhabdoformis]|uniref:BlaI/MecI/CopY family transcriptional regulator n=1 Tax=Amycolatopsis rhabdoformis TaxID=1448059 RepID=A0ABZ1IJA7_9PSEU|nr:BlaI/MecI/CopY family transcriptional regulator [Amycolatopsis rhabdoformis]WSE33634.1 BlaI/MecI/CopY family transcriptional regulator [Amycolatopsis rhabdoformis]
MRKGPGELEAEVLAVLLRRGQASATQVRESLGDTSLAYTTVVTILSRLFDKGVLTREKQGRMFAYSPVDDAPGLAARRMSAVLDSEHNRKSVLAKFVSTLSPADEHALLQLLQQERGSR